MEHPERSGKLWDYLKIVEYRLYTPKETLARARSRIGESNYNLFSNNCEHFALWCKRAFLNPIKSAVSLIHS